MRCVWPSSFLVLFLLGAAPRPPEPLAPDVVATRVKEAGDAEKHKSDTVVVLDYKDVVVRANGIGTARTQRVVKVLRDAGLRGQAVQAFPFDPHTNRVEVRAVRVYRKDGRIEDLALPELVKQPQPADGIFWPTDQYLVTVPALEVGDAVESISDMTGFNVAYLSDADAAGNVPDECNAFGDVLKPPVPGHWHDEVHFFTTGQPILDKRYSVRLPKNKPLQFEVYNGELTTGVLFEGDEVVYNFNKADLKPLSSEPAMEPWPNVGTKLLLATLPTWEDKSRWLYEVSEPTFKADDAIRAKTAEIIKGLESDDEKFTALNHWVAENIRYAGTSRGMCEGYTNHPVIETFHDRCGVCKDKAGMLVGMLRVAGYESYLTMTMARQRVDRVPADQFNHAVTVVRLKDGSLRLLDPTWMPKSRDNWSTLEPDQHVVYGVPEGKGLSLSPYFPPEDCLAAWRGQSEMLPDNTLRGRFSFEANGAPETRLRRALAGLHPADRGRLFDQSFQRLSPNARIKQVSCMDPVDFSGPIKVDAEYEATQYALGGDGQRYLALPLLQNVLGDRTLSDLFGQTSSQERKYGVKLWATRLARFEETVNLPPDWKVTKLPDPVELDGPAAALKFRAEAQPGRIHYTCDLVVKKWLIPAREYGNYKEVIEKFEELTGRVVRIELEGAHAQR